MAQKVDNIEDGRVRLANRATSLLSAIHGAIGFCGGLHHDELMKAIQSFEK